MKRILWFIGLALSVQLAAVGLAQYPRTLTDDLGRSVTLKAAPKRLVVMLPSLTETICALGACGRIVGVDTYSNFPEAVNKLPKVGGLYDPNLEAILALKPDLVLISVYGKLQEPLEKAGVPTFALKIESYDDIARTTRLLGQILNLRSEAERLIAKIQAQVYAVEAKAAATKDRPTVYYEIDPTPYTAGPDSFIGVLIAKARGVNIIPKELGAFPQISPELVVQKNPDVIVLTHPGLADLKKRPGWSGIKAVKTGRICDFSSQADDDLLSRPGPRVAQGLQLLVTCFHGK
ncbi:MAG: ABC transporter substrate-binding protein [Thermaceae bacterium]|nr:ABC transporter substrate-binding protein [Thermaceae bacterium]